MKNTLAVLAVVYLVAIWGECMTRAGDAQAPTSRPAASQPPVKQIGSVRLTDKVVMKLALLPAGEFTMGSPKEDGAFEGKARSRRLASDLIKYDEGPQRVVTISQSFYMGVCEVTQEQYEAIMGANPSHFKGASRPVDSVSWDNATAFCKKASEKAGRKLRLPTEAEWEYACRAGSKTRFCFGDEDKDLGDYAWFRGNSGHATHPVGQKKPNAWGLYDMHGNVWEWCSDWYSGSYAGASSKDPDGPKSGLVHVLRGGSWVDWPPSCRSAYRGIVTSQPGTGLTLGLCDPGMGFRVVVSGSAMN